MKTRPLALVIPAPEAPAGADTERSVIIAATEVASVAKLTADWAPWKFQVCTFGNGDHYGSPGKRICTGMANFITEQDARRHFDFINKLRGEKP